MYILIINTILLLNVYVACDEVLINTNVGQVVGDRREHFTAFLGVPYGVVDDDNPFSAATAPPYFNTPYPAVKDPPVCPQLNLKGYLEGSMQCLNLNIITPNNHNDNLPVMVYLHGGRFILGNGNLETYDPRFLVRHGVIFITVNYRLGPYGFLCLPELGYGNQGIKDIIFALKWIKDNIRSFGGDDNNILLFGHSAGAALTDIILQYNDKNVFNKVILHSSQIVSPLMSTHLVSDRFLITLAKNLNIDTKNLKQEEILKKISRIDPYLVVNATNRALFRPCIDNVFNKKPKKENMNGVTVMAGHTDRDIVYNYKTDGIPNDLKERLNFEFNEAFNQLPLTAVKSIKKFYNYFDDIVAFGTDLNHKYPIERSVRFYRQNNATVFRYVFSYDGGRNYCKIRENFTAVGATHSDELGYLFDIAVLSRDIAEEDQRMIDIMTTYWTNFAKYGNPTPKFLNVTGEPWLKVDDDHNVYMNITSSPTLVDDTKDRVVEFWDSIYELYKDRVKGWGFS